MRYISENLIWYSESTINSLNPITRQIFSYSLSSGRKVDSKTANFNALFDGFGPFSRQPLEISWRNLARSETKWIRKTRSQDFEPSWRYLGSKLPKIAEIDQNFMDDPKNFWIFFCIFGISILQFAKKSNETFFGRFSPLWWSGTFFEIFRK